MRASTTRLLTWPLWAICLAITLGALVLGALSDSAASPGQFGSKAIDVAVSLAILSFPSVGALIAWRRPENPIGWIFIMAGVAAVTANFATEYGDYALIEEPSLPAGAAAYWLQTWVWVPAVGAAGTFLVLLVPDGKLPSARWRPVAWAAGASIAATVLAYSLKPGRLYDAPVPVGNPVGLEGLGGLLDVVGGIATLALVASILAALVSLVVRFRRARGDERQQLKWFVSAIALLAITVPGAMVFAGGSDAGALLMSVAFLAIPVSAAVAIFKYRLYDIDLIVNRALVSRRSSSSRCAIVSSAASTASCTASGTTRMRWSRASVNVWRPLSRRMGFCHRSSRPWLRLSSSPTRPSLPVTMGRLRSSPL